MDSAHNTDFAFEIEEFTFEIEEMEVTPAPRTQTLADRIRGIDGEKFHGRLWICEALAAGITAEELLAAHRAGEIRLQAANLIDAVDPRLAEASEIHWLSSYYHLVVV